VGTDGGCGCTQRQDRLNALWPGLGDLVARVLDPIAKFLGIEKG